MAWKPIKAVSARVASFAEEVMSWEMEADPLGMAACGNGMLAVLDTRQELHLIDFDESQYKVVPLLPEWITGQHDTVALRVSDHPLVRELCALVGPIVSTSANPAGLPAARTRLKVEQYFRGQIDHVLGGNLGGRKNPSLIRDLATGKVVRPD